MTSPDLPSADPADLRRLLDGRWAHIRDLARRHLRGERFRPVFGLGVEEHRERVLGQLKEIAATEMSSYGFSGDHGGADDVGGSVVAFEMLVCDLSLMVKVGVQWGLFGGAVQALGTERHHAEFLPGIMSLEIPGCFAMTETGHGSDVQRLRTTAEYDPATGEFVVTTPDDAARKDYIGNAARDGRYAVVFAQLRTRGEGHGVHALLVPIRDAGGRPLPGVRIEDCGPKAGLNGVDNGRLWFDRVRVPREALLNRYGDVAPDGTYSSPIESPNRRFFTMLGTLVRGRISVAGGAGSATKAALAIAVKYAEARRQFDRPGSGEEVRLLDYRAHQRRLLPALARTYALHFAQEELVSTLHDRHSGEGLHDEHGQRELEARAAGLKAVATWHATRTIQTCREACGGAGYLAENRLPQLKADTDVFTTFEGDNTVLLQLVAKGLLTNYRQEFGDLDPMGMARFAAGQFLGAVIERTAARSLIERLVSAAPGRGDASDLRDRGWQLKVLEDRERHVLDGLARRLRRASAGGDAFAVFNDAQDHVLAAGRAHIDRIVLEAFVAGIDRCPEGGTKALLDKVCDLYVLSVIEEDRAWFLEHERLTATRAKTVTQEVNRLCRELRPHAETLVDAFGLADEWLAAPIALGAEAARQEAQRAHAAGRADEAAPTG
ncbi:acyl-CoA dehydrogenase [Streptomonospora nanhaiensis]|uniref:acyl-CoA oxidase n=1 Tax=Streptomonospora nanhaiensis TaxID=1323731 RepID=A0A853BLQ8_9ACTN|nr:acyl-CoA dehydrogenase [Streptomonospora nanhaiensis]MBV2365608.1 acyl-CoA dehydrogenase family protein [Streptomonospora nanhaiensis]MBX9389589.1 acyl-CoA dehydrogenase family protein [Streptomonospora nanhaiensis]NYI95506.1 acyl-CoA oxidase [Streptomonospora nanhaiensis]